MKRKSYSSDKFFIVLKLPDETKWQIKCDKINTPTTITYALSTTDLQQTVKKITWDLGNGNQYKSFTNRKCSIYEHTINCKYRKSHNTTIMVQASVYTENNAFVTQPITITTTNIELKEYYVEPEIFKNQILKFYKTKIFTGDVADSIYKIANRLAFAPNFINYCVDEQTEALTTRGWLTWDKINQNDTILSYDTETGYLIWSQIKDIYINKKYNGPMHKMTNQGIDSLVTPGHRFVTKERGLVEVETIKSKEHIVLMGKPLQDNKTEKYTNDFVELVGWAVTEGNYVKGVHTHSLQIFQKRGPKADLIRNCLERQNIKYKEYKWSNPEILGFRFNREYANLIINTIAPNKVVSPNFILDLTYKQKLLLLDTMIKGDGYIINRKNNKITYGYSQKDKKHIDTFLMLCTLCGITTSHEKVTNHTPFGISTYYTVYFYENTKSTCSVEHTNFYGGRPGPGGDLTQGKKHTQPTQHYKGVVWCPTTEYGTFVCKRKKYIYISGNSYRDEMIGDAVVRMVEALTTQKFDPLKGNPFSYFTKIAFHAFCNRIKREKRIRETLVNYQNDVYNNMNISSGRTNRQTEDAEEYEMHDSEEIKQHEDIQE